MEKVYMDMIKLDEERRGRFGETMDESTMTVVNAMNKRLFACGAFTIYVTPHMDNIQGEYMRILKMKCETLVKEDNLQRFVNNHENVDFFQIVEMEKNGKVQSYFVCANDLIYEVAASLHMSDDAQDDWAEWRSKVVMINNIPEFLLTLVIQLDHEYVDDLFPSLKQVYYTLEDPVFDGVCPRASTHKVVQRLASNVDMGEWIKMYYLDKVNSHNADSSHPSSGFMSSLGASSPASTTFMLIPSAYKDLRGDVVVSLMCNILADIHGNGSVVNPTGESHYHIPTGFDQAPHAIHAHTNAIRENVLTTEIPTEIADATRALVKKYRGVGHKIQEMEPFQKVFTVFAPTIPMEYNEAINVIQDICGADNLAVTEKDGCFMYLRGRYLGLEYENSYMHQGEEGVGGLIRFFRMIGIPRFSIDYVDYYAWYQMDNGLLIHMPLEVTKKMREGAALFCAYMFPVPAHIGHPLLRYVALGRILCVGTTEEFLWGVRIMLYHMCGDFEAAMQIGTGNSDNIDLDFVRGCIQGIVAPLLRALASCNVDKSSGSSDALSLVESLTGDAYMLLLRVLMSLCVCCFADRKEIEKRFASDMVLELRESEDACIVGHYVTLLYKEIQNVDSGITERAYFLQYVDAWCLITSGACCDHSFGDQTYSLSAVKESVLQHSNTDNWKTVPIDAKGNPDPEKTLQECVMAIALRFESALCSLPIARLVFHYRANYGACNIPLERLRIPLFRAYNSLTPLAYEHQCIPMARIGDITDPIIRPQETEKYYTEKGHVYNRLHPSVFYGCDPALLSDILCHRTYCASPDSPVVTTRKKSTGFENDIATLYNATMGIVRQKLFKRKLG